MPIGVLDEHATQAAIEKSRMEATASERDPYVSSPNGPEVTKRDCWPVGEMLIMVVPVPCLFPLLLKLATRTSPAAVAPPDGNPGGTKATP